jgi:septum formation topological specificity factor MinE
MVHQLKKNANKTKIKADILTVLKKYRNMNSDRVAMTTTSGSLCSKNIVALIG